MPLIYILLFLIVACDKPRDPGRVKRLAHTLGLVDPAPPIPKDIPLLCDRSAGSGCDSQVLNEALSAALAPAADAQGSEVFLYIQGDCGESLVRAGRATSPKFPEPDDAAREAWIAAETARLLRAAKPHFDQRPAHSPIAESISRVMFMRGPAIRPRELVLASDLREFSPLGDFECDVLPKAGEFFERLDESELLQPGSLANTRVRVVGLSMPPVDGGRCEWTIAREKQLRALWKAAFLRAGATAVEFRSDFEWQEVNDVPRRQ